MKNYGDGTLTIELNNKKADELRLDDFLSELTRLTDALKETERLLYKQEPTLYLRIKELKKNSPAFIKLEIVSESNHGQEFARMISRTFTTGLRYIGHKSKVPQFLNNDTLKSYSELGKSRKEGSIDLKIMGEGSRAVVVIDDNLRETIDNLMGPNTFRYGSISGRVEKLNLHNSRKFWIYPEVGPARVTATFKEPSRKQVTEAVDQYVTVYGRFTYKPWDRWPFLVAVEDIVVHKEVGESLRDLKGVAPGATGNLSTEEFIEKLRDEWETA